LFAAPPYSGTIESVCLSVDQVLIQRDTVKIRYRDEEWELEGELSVREAIEEVGLSPDRLIAVRDGEIVNEEVVIQEGDEIKLLALIAGG